MLRRIFMDLNRLERELDYIANAPRLALAARSAANKTRQPMADIRETETKVIAAFELPGVSKEDIQLNITNEKVEVRVEIKSKRESGEKAISHQMMKKTFYGVLPLPTEVDAEKAEATYINGMLRIEIPKAKKQNTRIEIK